MKNQISQSDNHEQIEQLNQQIQNLKEENIKTKNEYDIKIKQITQESEMKIKNLQNQLNDKKIQVNQNLNKKAKKINSNKTRIKD